MIKQKPTSRLFLAVAFVLFGGYLLISGIINLTDNKKPLITPAGKRLQTEVVDTLELRRQGLSGRETLLSNQAMLFVFDETGGHCMWMKDMKFNIDIVWLDEAKKVVDVASDVSPSTYPASFCPKAPARYVLELKSGEAASNKIEIGAQARF